MKKLSWFDKTLYGIGNLSNGAILQGLTSYLVFFGTTILGVPGTLIGTMVAVSVVWDAVSDPLIGHWSDYTKSQRFGGRRHLYMLVGMIGLAIFNAFLWSIQPEWTRLTKTILIFLNVILVKTFMTSFATPYNALGGELTYDYHERTSVQSYRTIFFTLGLAFTTVGGMFFYFRPTVTYVYGQLNPEAYRMLGFSLSVIALICGLITFLGTFKHIPSLPTAPENRKSKGLKALGNEFRAIFNNYNYLMVAGAYLSANLASALTGSIGLHVFTYTFDMDSRAIGVLFGTIFLLSILSQPFWIEATKRYDKKNGALLAVGISFVGALLFLFFVLNRHMVTRNDLWLLLYAIPTGVGVGGLITLPFSMIADTVDEEEMMTGHRSEGLYYGGLTFSYKISQSVAIFLVGILLDLAGFDSGSGTQGNTTVLVLGLVVAIGTIVALIGAWHFYQRYELTKEKVDAIKAMLDQEMIS